MENELTAGFRLSPQQRRIWVRRQGNGVPAVVQAQILLAGELDSSRLRRALEQTVGRHEILRTRFPVPAGMKLPVQTIAEDGALDLPENDLRGMPEEEQEAFLAALFEEELSWPIDLEREVALSAALVVLGPLRHALTLRLPALCSDAAGLCNLAAEIARAYAGGPAGEEDGPVQYADLSEWQQELLESADTAAGRERWSALLDERAPEILLPGTLPDVAGTGGRESVEVPLAGISSEIEAAAAGLGASPSAVLLAAWTVLLARWTGGAEIELGVACDGRRHEELREALGPLAKNLPLRSIYASGETFARTVERVAAAVDERARYHEYFDATGTRWEALPLAFDFADWTWRAEAGGVSFSVLRAAAAAEPAVLRLSAWRGGEGVRARLVHDGTLEGEEVRRLAERLAALLRAAVTDPRREVGDLDLLGAEERRLLFEEMNATARLYGPATSLHGLFERQAAATPAAPAVAFEGVEWSYGELDARACRVARALADRGVGAESRVGVFLDRSLEMVAAILGILKAGAAFVPLDPSYPAERLAFMAEDAGLAALLTESRLLPRVPASRPALCVDELLAVEEALPALHAGAAASPEALAYVIYTSGSTGQPKGVMVSHGAIVNHLRWVQEAYVLAPGDSALQKTPLGFDVAMRELFWPLSVGARLVVAAPGGHQDSRYLAALAATERIAVLNFVPALLRAFVEEPEAAGLAQAGLRRIIAGGEALTPDLRDRCLERLGVTLHNQYGPTETAVTATFWTVAPGDRRPLLPIGRPIGNARVYVVDGRLTPAILGAPGELAVAGAGLARGYLDRPELTAERFVPDPWGEGGRLYRTGDLVRVLPEGALEFLGRLDQQVKIRGLRVELGEIESVLAGLPGVARAVVAAREDSPAGTRLAAYLVPQDGARGLAAEEIRRLARLRLPDYMVPAVYTTLAKLPLTPSGKVDRKALPAPAAEESRAASLPRTQAEELVAGMFCRLLGRQRVGRDDDFFLLGGHSLLGTQLIARVREAFRLDLPLRTVFEVRTVAGLAARIEAGRPSSDGAPPLVRRPRGGDLPLSFSQRRLWFLHRLEPESPAYNIPGAVRLSGPLDLSRFAAALSLVVRRHEALRTVFPERSGQPSQVILPAVPVAMPLVDLTALPEEVREREARGLAGAEARKPFDLARGPLLRARALRLGPRDHLIAITLHHIVSDGWSRGILVREVAAGYRALAADAAPSLPELPVQYADYAAWQQEWLGGDALAGEIEHWRQRLGEAGEMLRLPTDRPRPAVYGYRGRQLPVVWPAALSEGLAARSQESGTTLFMTLLGLFQILLARYSGQVSLRVGSPVAGRDRVELEELIGFFVNTLVFATDLSGSPSLVEVLRRVRSVALDAHAHQNVPFERLVDELEPRRDLSHTPLFQVAFAFQNAPGTRLELPGVELTLADVDTETAKFDLTLGLAQEGDGLRGSLEYNTDLFEETTAARMAGHLWRLAEEAVADPSRSIWELPLLTATETEELLAVAGGEEEYPVTCLHRRFEAVAARRPETVAVSDGEHAVTYGELDHRATRLASRLLAAGVGPEDAVALCAEPGAGLVAGIVGILKAGAAYVPINPAHPRERLSFLVEDSAARAAVTERGLSELFAAGLPRVFLDERDEASEAGVPADLKPVAAWPEQRAYVIYTSGSTGRPKGVAVTHANVARLFTATDAWFGFGAEDVWTLFHSAAFDFSVWEIWGALLYGGRLVIVPRPVTRSPEEVHQLLVREGVTVLNQTPSAFRQLTRVAAESGERLPSLRYIVFGGEALELPSLRPWLDLYGEAKPLLVNMYGITETTVHVTWRPIGLADLEGARSVVGGPIPDLRLHLADRAGGLTPLGVPGEIRVGGAGLARGYVGRPDLTAERFVPDPWSGGSGARLYSSGDLARRLPGGDLEYLGRIDEQVKIRGFRIELGEIEAALASLPSLAEGAVLAKDDGHGGRRLVAWVVPRGEVTVDSLRRALAERLPDYMVPAQFVFLPALPLTGNGKLDRRALPDPGTGRADLGPAYTAPSSEVEEILAGVWGRVLQLERVGVHDNFFTLGGDSILSIQVVALARERGLELSIQQLFLHQTIAELAAQARLAPPDAPAGPREPFSLLTEADRLHLPEGLEDAYPLTRLQDGMLYHLRLAEVEQPYHNLDSFHLRGRFDEKVFAEAWRRVVARHPVLRTSFDLVRFSEPLQLVHRTAEPGLEIEDLRGLPPAEQEERIDAFLAERRSRPLALARPPLLRFHVHRRTEDTFQLTLIENHAILDGWSLHSTLAEVFALQEALLEGREVPEPTAVPVSFRDFVALERQAVESEESRLFWEERLEGAALLELPRRATPPAAGPRVRIRRAPLPAGTSEGLKAAARAAAVPTKSVLLAAHLAVLARLSGQADVVTGLVSNGRPEVQGGDQVRGLFLNTLPLRLRLGGGSWCDLARAVFDEERAVLPHRRVPLSELLGGERTPRFEAAFNYVHFHVVDDALKPGGYEVLDTRIHEATNFVLSATFGEDPAAAGEVFLQAAYDSHRLDDEAILRIEGLYLAALAAIAADPRASHERLDGLAEAERQSLAAWSASPPLDRLPALPVHELFSRQAAATPFAVAVRGGERSLDYAALDRAAGLLAGRLVALGIGPEVRVGLFLRPRVEMVAAVFGVLRAGGAYVPVDPAYPRERIEWLLEDSAVSVVLSEEDLLADLPPLAVPVLTLDSLVADAAGLPEEAPRPRLRVDDDNLAYVIYTSGSTGRPNGALISHGGLRHYLEWCLERYGPALGDGTPLHSSIGFDLTVTSLFAPLLAGKAVTLVEPGEGAGGLEEALAAGPDFSLIKLTPAHLELLRRACVALPPGRLAAAARALVVGGEALFGTALAAWRRQAPEVRIFNEYGPTETVVGCCVHEVPPGVPEPGPVPIGRPISGMEAHLLDGWLRPVPVGAVGEIYLGGRGLGRGYLGRPAVTASRWVPHPFPTVPGERLYRTGDLARRLPGGDLVFLGRRDLQVKVRGHRIEPGEIETALERHPGVHQAAVVVDTTAEEGRLVAFFTSESEEEGPGPVELRDFLRRSLPAALVPGLFVRLGSLPLSGHGKVDRRRLLAEVPAAASSSTAAPEEASWNPVEQLLTAAFRELLRVEAVGRDDGFFDLGGHSLLATRLLGRIAQTFGVDLPLAALFEAPTVPRLAAKVEAALAGGGEPLPPVVPAPRDEPPPLSFAQQRLWFLDQLEPGGAAYNMPLRVRLEGQLEISTFVCAFAELSRRHEALRTRFAEVDGEPRQIVGAPAPAGIPLVDLAGLAPAEGEAEARRLAAQEAARPFDLARGPVVRIGLLRLAPAEHVLLLTVHHVVSDAWSMEVLVRELTALYAAFRSGRPSPLAGLPVQYADYAVWQRRWLAGGALDRQLEWWRSQLAGAPPPTRLPLRRTLEGPVSARGGHCSFTLPADRVGGLKRLAREEGVTLFMVLLAAFEALLHRATGETDLMIGTDLANRRRPEVEGLIGFFVNVLPVRLGAAGRPTFRELLARVREAVLGLHAHQDVPLERLAEELAPGRGQGRSPFFEMLFVYLPPSTAAAAAGLKLSPFEAGYETSRFDLVLYMGESGEEVRGTFGYRRDLFAAPDVESLAERFQALLASAAAQPDARLDDLDWQTDRERRERDMQLEGQEKASFSKFKRIKPKAVSLPQGDLVRTGHLDGGGRLPLVVEPIVPDLDLAGWAGGNLELLEDLLARHGALLFRGFHLPAVADFERFAGTVCPALFGEYGDLPRANEGRKVYNSTPYPADKTILFHNESSHMHQWPQKQFFYCVIPSETGGETPIVDCRRVYQLLPSELCERFESKGLMYVRNFTEGLDVRWQDFFMTDDRAEVETYCRDNGIQFTWHGDRLQTRQVAPAVIEHGKTGEKVFFNQIQLHHISCVEPELRESLSALFAPDELPRNVFYGDGSPIADEDVATVLDLYWQECTAAPWQKGDALMVDNTIVAHARNPFTGARKIAVAMGEMVRRDAS